MLHQIVYISTATKLFDEEELKNLLVEARRKNHQLSVTGLLLYKDQSFIQLIEGPRKNVVALYEVIKCDLRHMKVRILLAQDKLERTFNSWSMGFFNLNQDDGVLDGYSDYFSNTNSLDELVHQPDSALELLAHFRARS